MQIRWALPPTLGLLLRDTVKRCAKLHNPDAWKCTCSHHDGWPKVTVQGETHVAALQSQVPWPAALECIRHESAATRLPPDASALEKALYKAANSCATKLLDPFIRQEDDDVMRSLKRRWVEHVLPHAKAGGGSINGTIILHCKRFLQHLVVDIADKRKDSIACVCPRLYLLACQKAFGTTDGSCKLLRSTSDSRVVPHIRSELQPDALNKRRPRRNRASRTRDERTVVRGIIKASNLTKVRPIANQSHSPFGTLYRLTARVLDWVVNQDPRPHFDASTPAQLRQRWRAISQQSENASAVLVLSRDCTEAFTTLPHSEILKAFELLFHAHSNRNWWVTPLSPAVFRAQVGRGQQLGYCLPYQPHAGIARHFEQISAGEALAVLEHMLKQTTFWFGEHPWQRLSGVLMGGALGTAVCRLILTACEIRALSKPWGVVFAGSRYVDDLRVFCWPRRYTRTRDLLATSLRFVQQLYPPDIVLREDSMNPAVGHELFYNNNRWEHFRQLPAGNRRASLPSYLSWEPNSLLSQRLTSQFTSCLQAASSMQTLCLGISRVLVAARLANWPAKQVQLSLKRWLQKQAGRHLIPYIRLMSNRFAEQGTWADSASWQMHRARSIWWVRPNLGI